jgi:hypothetical protein
MPEYAPEGTGNAFAQSRTCFAGMEEWLSGAGAAGLTHAELEEQVDARGRELLRRMYQDHLDLRAAREQRRETLTGADGVARTRAETGHTRPLATVFGQVTVTRIAYRAPRAPNLHPADAALNLPEEKHSHGLLKLAAARPRAARSRPRATRSPGLPGVTVGKRQVEHLARAAAADIDAFYAARRPGPAGDEALLVMQYDGKGIVMRPGALREATAKAAAAARASWPPGSRQETRTAASAWPSLRPSTTQSRCHVSPATSSARLAAESSRAAAAPRSRKVADRLGYS